MFKGHVLDVIADWEELYLKIRCEAPVGSACRVWCTEAGCHLEQSLPHMEEDGREHESADHGACLLQQWLADMDTAGIVMAHDDIEEPVWDRMPINLYLEDAGSLVWSGADADPGPIPGINSWHAGDARELRAGARRILTGILREQPGAGRPELDSEGWRSPDEQARIYLVADQHSMDIRLERQVLTFNPRCTADVGAMCRTWCAEPGCQHEKMLPHLETNGKEHAVADHGRCLLLPVLAGLGGGIMTYHDDTIESLANGMAVSLYFDDGTVCWWGEAIATLTGPGLAPALANRSRTGRGDTDGEVTPLASPQQF